MIHSLALETLCNQKKLRKYLLNNTQDATTIFSTITKNKKITSFKKTQKTRIIFQKGNDKATFLYQLYYNIIIHIYISNTYDINNKNNNKWNNKTTSPPLFPNQSLYVNYPQVLFQVTAQVPTLVTKQNKVYT